MKAVRDVIKPREIYIVNVADSVRTVATYLCERRIGAVAVLAEDKIAGVVSERDILRRVVHAGLSPDETPVSEIMSTKLISIQMNDDLLLAKAVMFMNGVRHLLVIGENDTFQGLLSVRDLMEADLAGSKEIVDKLNDKYYEQSYRTGWRMSSNRVIIEPYVPPKEKVQIDVATLSSERKAE